MKGNLTFKLIYTPSNDTNYGACESNINFLCSDNKLHIRLREYDKEEVISGFIDKLTYLITYLKNNTNDIEYTYEENKLNSFIKSCLHEDKYKGIAVSNCYRKLKSYNKQGYLPHTLCPYSNVQGSCSLSFFTNSFKINLYDFLFNDAYEISITKNTPKTLYKKYSNKNKVSSNKILRKKVNISLWNSLE